MVRNIKERVRNYLNKQCETNLPATYQGFVSENPGTDITSVQFSDAAKHLKSEFENDSQKVKWYNSVRKGLNGLTTDETAKYFPQRIHINTGKHDVRSYLNEQCAKKLPATYLDFKTKNPNTKIKESQVFLSYVASLKKEFVGTPERKHWYNEIRSNREKLNPEQVPLYYTRKYVAGCVPQVNEYLLKQCAHHLPGTYRGFKSEHPKTKITSTQFGRAVKFLRSDFEKDREKAEWYNTIRTSPDGLTLDEIAKYFPKKIHLNTSRHEVRKYLNEQCAKKLPATYLDFKKKHPKTKIENAGTFGSYVAQVKIEFMETPERKEWFNEIRANKEKLKPEQASLYYDSSRKFVTGSNTDQIRQYLLKQCAQGLPGTYAGFLAQSPDSTITLRQFNDSVKNLKGEFAKDPAQKNWMENTRLKKTGLTLQQKKHYFPPQKKPGQTELVRQFLKDQRQKNGEVTYETFCDKFPKSTLAKDEYFNIIYSKLKPEYMQDPYSKNWFEDKFPSRATRSEYTAHIGTVFDKCMVAGIYTILKDKNISVYYDTTSFVQTGHHPKKGKKVDDPRVELRIFTRDLLNRGKDLGVSLQNFLRKSNRPELVIDVSLSSFIRKKISKYADPSSCLLIIVPKGTKGQQPLEPHVRVLSLAEFLGPNWLNLDPAVAQKLLDDLDLALNAVRNGPGSQADQDLRATMENKWNQVKSEIKSNASQKQYEARVLQEISDALRHGEIPKQLEGYVQAARQAGHEQLAAKLELLANAMAALGKVIRKKKDVEQSKQGSEEQDVDKGIESESQTEQSGERGTKEKQQTPEGAATSKSNANIDPENDSGAQKREDAKSGGSDAEAETWAKCAAMFPNYRRQRQQQLLEEELAWENYELQLGAGKGENPLKGGLTSKGAALSTPPVDTYKVKPAMIENPETGGQAETMMSEAPKEGQGVPTPEDMTVAQPAADASKGSETETKAEAEPDTGNGETASEAEPESIQEGTTGKEGDGTTDQAPEDETADKIQETSEKIHEPAIEVTSNGGALVFGSGDPNGSKPPDGKESNAGIQHTDASMTGGEAKAEPQRQDGTAIPAPGDKSVQLTGSDLQRIHNAGIYGDKMLLVDKDGRKVLLSSTDTKNIHDALDHAKKAINNARTDVCGPDPTTKAQPDGRDITGDGKRGTPITGQDLHDIRNAGARKEGVIIAGEHGNLQLDGKDTKDIHDALDHVRHKIDAARPEDARQSMDGPVANGREAKNANPPEDSYSIHDPKPAGGQTQITPDDLRDIRAAGRGDVQGYVVIDTNAGRKTVSQDAAKGINDACDRLSEKLSHHEPPNESRSEEQGKATTPDPTHEEISGDTTAPDKGAQDDAATEANDGEYEGWSSDSGTDSNQDTPGEGEEYAGWAEESGQDSTQDAPEESDEYAGWSEESGQDSKQDTPSDGDEWAVDWAPESGGEDSHQDEPEEAGQDKQDLESDQDQDDGGEPSEEPEKKKEGGGMEGGLDGMDVMDGGVGGIDLGGERKKKKKTIL